MDRSGVLHITPTDFAAAVEQAVAAASDDEKNKYRTNAGRNQADGRPTCSISGWAGCRRVHPLVLPSGRWILPLYSDTFDCSIMAITDDRGATWTASKPLIGFGNIQASLVREE